MFLLIHSYNLLKSILLIIFRGLQTGVLKIKGHLYRTFLEFSGQLRLETEISSLYDMLLVALIIVTPFPLILTYVHTETYGFGTYDCGSS